MKIDTHQQTIRLICILVVITALFAGWQLRWVCDDAFISFRYAENFASGKGLVYNEGEYVEGYTNFLWTCLLSIVSLAGGDLPFASQCFGVFFWGVFLGGLGFREKRIGLAAVLGAACCFHLRVFATSGLETSMFLACIVWLVRMCQLGNWNMVGLLGGISCLIRPEGGLFFLAGCLSLRIDGKWQHVFKSLSMGAIVLIPFATWKLFYYGDLLPNTFYAKAGSSNWKQGFLYVGLFFGMYWFMATGILFQIALLKTKNRRVGILTLVLFIGLLIHVTRVGGDFMFARFCLPMIPLLLIAIDELLLHRMTDDIYLWASFAVGGFVMMSFYPNGVDKQDGTEFGISGITEERVWYPAEWQKEAKRQGEIAAAKLQDTDASVVIYGAQAMFAYYSQIPYVLEGMAGLTDADLARKESRADRVAHGRKADQEYLWERGIDLYIDFRIGELTHGKIDSFRIIDFGDGVNGVIHCYRIPLMEKLKERGVSFQDFPAFLDQYISSINDRPPEVVAKHLGFFQNYYFHHNEDPIRESAIRSYVSQMVNGDL